MNDDSLELMLEQIKLILPPVELDKIDLDAIMNLHANGDLVNLFQRDLLLFSFFSVLGKRIKVHLVRKQNQLEDLESDLYVKILDEQGTKTAATEVKRRIQRNTDYRTLRNLITEIEGKQEMIESLVDALTKKSIALSVITARESSELRSGLKN